MFKLLKNKIKIERVKNFFKKIPKTLAEHPFLLFCGFLIIALILGGFVFYKYVTLVEKSEINISEKISKFEESTYQEVLNQWRQREEKLKNIDSKECFNPFQGSGEIILSTSTEESTSTSEATSTPEENPPEVPEKPSPPSNIEKLLATNNLFEFFIIKDGRFPYLWERAIAWEKKGLGSRDYYYGSDYQNKLLLEALKKDLTK